MEAKTGSGSGNVRHETTVSHYKLWKQLLKLYKRIVLIKIKSQKLMLLSHKNTIKWEGKQMGKIFVSCTTKITLSEVHKKWLQIKKEKWKKGIKRDIRK